VNEATVCVRLKPHLPRAGQVLRHFVYRGVLFKAGAGWSKVSFSIGEYLKTVRQRALQPHSAPAFDVCTEEEARRLDALDAERNTEAVPVERARVLVARDEAPTAGPAGPTGPASIDPTRDRPSARAKH
jgi:hypothetical protein